MNENEQTHTPGPWYVEPNHPLTVVMDNWIIARAADVPIHGQGNANARLIAEAGTVATETGLSPRQLADRCARYRAALVTLVGSDKPDELVAFRRVVEAMNLASQDQQMEACLLAIDALLVDDAAKATGKDDDR